MYTIKEEMTFGGNKRCWRRGGSKPTIFTGRSINPSISYFYPQLKRFYLGSIYVVFGIVTALNMNVMLWDVSLLYINDHQYSEEKKLGKIAAGTTHVNRHKSRKRRG